MVDKNESLNEKLRALEAVFLQKLPSKFDEIRAATESLKLQPDSTELLAVLHRHLHTLAGSAGTFGFEEIGAQARIFERKLKPLLSGQAMSPEDLAAYAEEVNVYFSEALHHLDKPHEIEEEDLFGTHGDQNGQRLVYLLAPDDAQNQEITAQLTHFGYEVQRIKTVSELVIAVANRRPNVIVLEPGDNLVNGVDEMTRIRQLAPLRIPTIFVAQTSSFESRLQAVRSNGDGYFTKPLDVVALTERIDALSMRDENRGFRILIIDDDSVTAKYYAAVLRDAGMNVLILMEPHKILSVIADFRPELLLMDVYMPACSGVELARIIRQDNAYVDVPIVFLSSEADPHKKLDAVCAGADDFITKPVTPQYLIASLAYRAERYRSLRALIMRDGLTGLFNHTAIKEQLVSELFQSGRNGSTLAIAVIDLDRFKQINDTYGHPVGDQVLRTLARLLRQRLRRSDIVGRYGGEEFVVIFPETNAAAAKNVLEQVRFAFAKIEHRGEKASFSVTFSAGVADTELSNDADTLFDMADAAMYVSKQSGRNRITLA